MRHEALSVDGTPVLAGAALLLAIVLLQVRQARACIAACALQSWVVALAAAWQGWVREEAELYGLALVVVATNGVLLPVALARIVRRPESRGMIASVGGAFVPLLTAFSVVVLAVLVVRPIEGSAAGVARETLAVALSIVLLGLAATATRGGTLAQATGAVSLENGLILAFVGLSATPFLAELAIALVAITLAASVASAAFGGWTRG